MAIVVSSVAQRDATNMLRETLYSRFRQGILTASDELIGYSLAGNSVAERYGSSKVPEAHHTIASPEIFRGLISNGQA